MILIYFSFLWAVFSGLFFLESDDTIWRAPNLLIGGSHYFIGLLLIAIFLIKINNKSIILKEIKNKRIFIIFILSTLLSAILNYTNIYDTIRFILTLLSPITVYLILVYDKSISYSKISFAFLFYILVCIVQLLIAIYINSGKLLDGIIIIDDFFRGTMSAYQFVFLLNLYSIYVINKLIILKKIKIIEIILFLIFVMSFIVSGAGGYLFIFVISMILNYIYIVYSNKQRIRVLFFSIPLALVLFSLISYFMNNYWLSDIILNKFIFSSLSNNPKIIITIQALQPIFNPLNFLFGLGPGQFLSGIGGNVNATYYGGTLLEEMGSSAYAVNSDFFSVLSEIGLLGLVSFYLLVSKFIIIRNSVPYYTNRIVSNNNKLFQYTIIGVFLYAILLSIQYRIFIFFVSSYILWFFLGILKRKLLFEQYKNEISE